jgi:uncharacterized protein with PQ loop repeat
MDFNLDGITTMLFVFFMIIFLWLVYGVVVQVDKNKHISQKEYNILVSMENKSTECTNIIKFAMPRITKEEYKKIKLVCK